MNVVKPWHTGDDSERGFHFVCPGCEDIHGIRTKGPKPCWEWNGSLEKPTVSPSILVGPGTKLVCHSFIKDGQIRFLGDSYHGKKNTTVSLEDYEVAFERWKNN